MMRYTDEQLDFLRQGFQHMTVAELTDAFNDRYGLQLRTSAIHSTIVREDIRRGRRILPGRRLSFTKEQIEYITTNYQRLPLRELAAAFNSHFGTDKTAGKFKCFITNHGIASGRTGCFPKGNLPWNTGTKGLTHGSSTSFKKGSTPANRKPLGTERITWDGYIEVKVAEKNPYTGRPTRWLLKHQMVWEQTHGMKIPAGHVVFFRDGKKTNCAPDNLELMSRAEEVRLNQFGYRALPADLKPNMRTLVKLVTKTGSLKRAAKQVTI